MLLVLLYFICSLLFFIYVYLLVTKNHDYWKKRNVRHDKPLPFFGNHLTAVIARTNMTYKGAELYKKYPTEKIVGYFRGRTPELIIRDPEIIKHILTADFPSFHSRGGFERIQKNPVMHSVFFLEGTRWSAMKQKIAPAFNAAKVAGMFPLVECCMGNLQTRMANVSQNEFEMNVEKLMVVFGMDCIFNTALGVRWNTISALNSDLVEQFVKFFDKTKFETFMLAFEELYPEWKSLHVASVISKRLTDLVMAITHKLRNEREIQHGKQKYLIDVLLHNETKGKENIKSNYERNPDGSMKEYSVEMNLGSVAAQITGIIFAGFETTASTTSFTLHQLAYQPALQTKIQEEIDQVIAKHGGLSYQAFSEMSLLEMTFKESLRMLPPTGLLRRECNREYTIPGTDVTITPGVKILVPLQAIHMDEKYFENPEEYRPERFAPDAKKTPAYAYIPFGEGPRKCAGMRLAYLQSLAGLVAVLQKYSVSPAASSKKQVTIKPTSYLIQIVEGGFPLKFTPRVV